MLGEVRESVLRHTHHMACTSSDEVLAASELGKGKGEARAIEKKEVTKMGAKVDGTAARVC